MRVKCLSPIEWRLGWLKSLFLVAGVVIAIFALGGSARRFDPALGAVFVALTVSFALYFWPSYVTLDEDGLAYRRCGLSRFVPYGQIESVESIQRLGDATHEPKSEHRKVWTIYCGLRLHLEGGGTLEVGTSIQEVKDVGPIEGSHGTYGHFGAFDRDGWKLRRALEERVRELRKQNEPATPALLALMRGEKSTAEWLTAIQATAPAPGAAYRSAEGPEVLWRVLEDEDAPREARAGAALALRAGLDEDGRHRMRVVVESCESPKLRVAIETALDEEAGEPRLLDALEQASLPRGE